MKNTGYTDRMLHVSAQLIPNPAFALALSQGKLFFGPKLLVAKPGSTYNVGRNKAKRERRELQRQRREKINERRMRVTD